MEYDEKPEGKTGRARRWRRWRRRAASVTAALLASGLFVAGCSGGSGSNTGHGGAGNGPAASHLAYAKCMRSHGAVDFPEPDSNGDIQVSKGQIETDQNSPQFKAAAQACLSLNPAGGPISQADRAQHLSDEVKYARCMRSHGVAKFPDPSADGSLDLQGIDVNNPQVKTADTACATPGVGIGQAGQS